MKAEKTTNAPFEPRLELEWDPRLGKGSVHHRTSEGDWVRTCFQCGFDGYQGGLVIGNYNGSGMAFYPKTPVHGHRHINLFCATDESIWDLDRQREYTFGWSENFGTGNDGTPLRYVKGEVLRNTKSEIVLRSTNEAGCYRVTKVARTRIETPYWIIATRIENTCDHPLRFDFFSGDDPWLGLYRTSDGDVGWADGRIIEKETEMEIGTFSSGGIWDRGNPALGQAASEFTGEANFIALDPASPRPDKVFFANAFAHRSEDIKPNRPLDNKTLTALNLGWTEQTLLPGQGFSVASALGRAKIDSADKLPRAPNIPLEDWSAWRAFLKEPPKTAEDTVIFAAETVDLHIDDRAAAVTGTYTVRNTGDAPVSMGIVYPIITAPDRPVPKIIEVDGREVSVRKKSRTEAEGRFTVQVPARGLAQFTVGYRQAHTAGKVVYMVTSAARWSPPLFHATFTVRHPDTFNNVRISYPETAVTTADGKVTHRIFLQPFAPDRELEVTFESPASGRPSN